MGYNQIVVALLLLATATPLAYGLIPSLPGLIPNLPVPIPNLPGLISNLLGLINAANVTGRICCTPTGNCDNGSVGIPGVAVNLNCTTPSGSVMTLARGITRLDGTFALLVNNINNLLGLQLGGITRLLPQCRVVVSLPLNSTVCPVLSTGTLALTGATALVSVVQDEVRGLVGNFATLVFSRVSVNT
ncbi:uncharacterized protein LOC121755002 [Salvia splendens]|uniref:uncharacterized protein LOC121755002 n=1 Tax=Salvia splendens TaxID=180675 RepID=UPI001C2751CB|nr:uncharacterized protein LOC121755002 [Salvia splendens]